MSKIKKKIILNTILENGIFNSSIGENSNSLLNNVLNKRSKKLKVQTVLLSLVKNRKRHRKLNRRNIIEKTKNFLSLIEQFSEDDFKRNFMMNRSTFMEIVNHLDYYWNPKTDELSLSLKTALYITIWKLTKNCTIRELAELFNLSPKITFTYFIKVANLLHAHRKIYIKWPSNIASKLQIMEKFENLINHSIPHTIGCVDATHISIVEDHDYILKNEESSLILQGICDSQQKFIDVFVKPGSSSKTEVWNSSPINDTLSKNRSETKEYILGDSEYPLKTYLIVPYKGILTSKQKLFNYRHSSTLNCVQKAFKKLKSNFSILDKIDIKNIVYVEYIVIACVVLHNIIIANEKTNDAHCEENNSTNSNDKAKVIRDKLAMESLS